MTYKQLAAYIAVMTDEERNCNVVLYDEDADEFYDLKGQESLCFAKDDPDLKDHHPYLAF